MIPSPPSTQQSIIPSQKNMTDRIARGEQSHNPIQVLDWNEVSKTNVHIPYKIKDIKTNQIFDATPEQNQFIQYCYAKIAFQNRITDGILEGSSSPPYESVPAGHIYFIVNYKFGENEKQFCFIRHKIFNETNKNYKFSWLLKGSGLDYFQIIK